MNEADKLVVSAAAALRRLSLEDRVSAITSGMTIDEIDYIAADLTQFVREERADSRRVDKRRQRAREHRREVVTARLTAMGLKL